MLNKEFWVLILCPEPTFQDMVKSTGYKTQRNTTKPNRTYLDGM